MQVSNQNVIKAITTALTHGFFFHQEDSIESIYLDALDYLRDALDVAEEEIVGEITGTGHYKSLSAQLPSGKRHCAYGGFEYNSVECRYIHNAVQDEDGQLYTVVSKQLKS